MTKMDVILSLLFATLLASTEGMLICNQTEQNSMQPTVTFGNRAQSCPPKEVLKASRQSIFTRVRQFISGIEMYRSFTIRDSNTQEVVH